MASPFRVFRKHQKTLMVIATLIAIFIFVVGDALMSRYSSRSGGGESLDAKATAVSWDGGKLTNRQLNELVFKRRVLNNFMKNVEMEGRRPSYEAGVDAPELRVQPLISPENQIESSVVRTKLLAEAAANAGMKVSNDTLVQYLNELGRRNVSPEKMRGMVNSLSGGGGGRLSIDYIIDALREQMLAHNYLISHAFGFETVTPQQRWKDWSRVNDRVIVEAAAVPAEMYMTDVKEPTDAELTAFFDKYKEREAVPDFYGTTEMPSATPGFRVPRKVDVQFIEASYDEFLSKAEAKITDAEVAKYYDEHKDLFPKTNVGLMDAKTDAPATKGESKDAAKDAKPADAEKKSAESTEKKSDSPAKKDDTPAKKDEKADEKSSDSKKSSSTTKPSKSVFRLTAFAEDTAKKEEKSDKPADKAADAPAAKAPAGDAKAAATTDKPATPPALAAPANTTDAAKATPGTPAAPAAEAPPKKPVEYQPLSEVKDEIRRRLAEGKVAEELSNTMNSIQADLEAVYEKWRFSDDQSVGDEKKELPPPPKSLTDFAAIAAKHGLKSGQTGPKSVLELRQLPVGKSTAIDANRTLLSMLFQGKDLETYQPVKTVDIDGNRFIAMKMSETEGKVPTLAEVKDEVIKAWKLQQAEELAKKHADEFAKKAEEAKSPLTGFFAENKAIKVVRTDPFSELTGGDVGMVGGQPQQQPYRFSQPSEIVDAGPEFMRGVFNLKDGQVGVLQNNDHTISYIVRVVEHQPSLAQLRNNYLADAYSWYGENIMSQMHRQEVAGNLESDIEARTKLKWERAPDQPKGEQSDAG